MAPDDEDDGDLYDDEFDFVDDEDDDLSDLDDESDGDDSDRDDDDSELDRADDHGGDSAEPEPVEQPARRPAPARRGRGGETRAADDQRDLFDRDRDDRDGGNRDQRHDDRHHEAEAAEAEAPEDLGPPPPPANYRVHVYEYQEFKRTIDRPFTAEDAEAFASEFNRTSKPYGRFAVAGKDDAKPKKMLD